MKRFLNNRLLLLSILLLAAFLRLWKLDSVPPSASMDEASIGYNAYSVMKIGVDEYGNFPFLSQRGYDDWRRSTYLFLVAPFVAIFGLNVISIRLPAVMLSVLTVLATYKIVLFIFSKKTKQATTTALLVAFCLAISPWHIYISRLGHESNAYLSFFVFGVLFFLRGLEDKKSMVFSSIFFTLSMISYYAGQVLVPLFVVALLLIYRKELFLLVRADKKILSYLVIFIILLLPIVFMLFSPTSLTRFRGTSTFNPEVHWEAYTKRVTLRNKAVERGDIVGGILYNRRLFPFEVFTEGYISHFNPDWLFKNSFKEPFKVPNMGFLYSWEIPFILLGVLTLVRSRDIDPRARKLIFLWFVLAPFPASIATQAPHAMRSYAFLPIWQIFTSFGLLFVLHKLQKIKILPVIIFLFLFFTSVKTFYMNYYGIFPREQSSSFHFALSKAIPYILLNSKLYSNVVFSNQDNLYQSYMLYLYYTQFDPARYQQLGGTQSGGYAQKHTIGTYEFRPLDSERLQKGTLYIANPTEISTGRVIEKFYGKDGSLAIVAKVL